MVASPEENLLSWCAEHLPPDAARAQVELMRLFASLPSPPQAEIFWPQYTALQSEFRRSWAGADPEAAEEACLRLYCHLHGNQGRYTAAERRVVDRTGGYWCHAGGVSPVVRAGPWLSAESVSLDLGAGNGLQLLLVQKLFPHRRSVMVEISSALIEEGKLLQDWLGIPDSHVEWVHADLAEYLPPPCDFLYLYRPLKPQGGGERFYRRLAAALSAQPRPPVIFSIADCLRDFLPPAFEIFYRDGHLTCFRPLVARSRPRS